jgi:uncharacterized membrane protein
MLRSLISGVLKTRIALWAVQLALPSGADLKHRFRSALIGVFVAVAAGVLCALCTFALFVGIGLTLHMVAGYSILQAVLMISTALIVIIVALIVYGHQKLREAFSVLEETASSRVPKSEDTIQELIDGFIEGLVINKPHDSKV